MEKELKFLEPPNRIGLKSMGTVHNFYLSMCQNSSKSEALSYLTKLCDPDNLYGLLENDISFQTKSELDFYNYDTDIYDISSEMAKLNLSSIY